MSFELKVLEPMIKFFVRVQSASEKIIHHLKYMKYEHLFDEREDDIYVATYLKSGTTWMQMILYQLTTPGDVDFKHIYEVSPWLRNLAEIGGEIPELPSPRIIKMHDSYKLVSKYKKGRYIYVIRDGRDVAVSLYHHQKNYVRSSISFEEVLKDSFNQKGDMNWFEFNRLWLENKNNLPILYIRYEDLHTNFLNELYRIAAFIGVEVKPEDVPRIVERCSFQFMKAHETKFGEQPPEEKHEIVYNQFIRAGNVGGGKQLLSEEQLKLFIEMFDKNLDGFAVTEPYKAGLHQVG